MTLERQIKVNTALYAALTLTCAISSFAVEIDRTEFILTTRGLEPPSSLYPVPSRTLLFAVRNLTTNSVLNSEYDRDIFSVAEVYGEEPDGTLQRIKLRGLVEVSFGEQRARRPSQIQRGEAYIYRFQREMTDIFGAMNKDGKYLIWWQVGDKKSNVLVFERAQGSLTEQK